MKSLFIQTRRNTQNIRKGRISNVLKCRTTWVVDYEIFRLKLSKTVLYLISEDAVNVNS